MDLRFFIFGFFCVGILDASFLEEAIGEIPTDPEYLRQNPPHEANWNLLAQKRLVEALKRNEPKLGPAKNVILFIGDGMGVTPITVARWHKGQKEEKKAFETHLAMDHMPIIGHSRVYTVDYITPDSAATGTALLCGEKTHIGVLGLSQDAQFFNCSSAEGNSLTSILDEAHSEGKWTGVVTTTRVTHATPASAYAHSVSRDWESDANIPEGQWKMCPDMKDIADQLITDNAHIRVILGGGRSKFKPISAQDDEDPFIFGDRLDERDLIREWKLNKHNHAAKYVTRQNEFDEANPEETDFLLGLFEPSHMNFEQDRKNDKFGEPSIAQMVEKAIKILQRGPEGYVLLVEGGRIDHGHHYNNAYRANEDILALSDAVTMAMDLTSEDDTLVVVTADHSHVLSFGGYHMINEDIYGVVKSIQGQGDHLADDEKAYTILNYANGPGWYIHRDKDVRRDPRDLPEDRPGVDNPDYIQDSAIPMPIETHGADDVAVYARGPMSHLLSGTYEQSFIAHAIKYATCIGDNKDNCETDASSGDVTTWNPVVMVMMIVFCALL